MDHVTKMAEDNATAIDEIKTLTDTLRTEVTERQDVFETKMQGRLAPGGDQADPFDALIKSITGLEAVTTKGITPRFSGASLDTPQWANTYS